MSLQHRVPHSRLQGAREIFELLPHEMVEASELPDIVRDGNPNTLYGCVVGPKDYTERKSSGMWNEDEYFSCGNYRDDVDGFLTRF